MYVTYKRFQTVSTFINCNLKRLLLKAIIYHKPFETRYYDS